MSEALSEKEISGGVVHDLPADLKKALISDANALETWEDIRLWRAMNGFAGSSRPKRQKQELAGSNGAVPASKMESGDPVVGPAVRIGFRWPCCLWRGSASLQADALDFLGDTGKTTTPPSQGAGLLMVSRANDS